MWIYNTQTRKKEEFQPLHEGKVGIYACGPTVYNYIHIGNARPLIVCALILLLLIGVGTGGYLAWPYLSQQFSALGAASGAQMEVVTGYMVRLGSRDLGVVEDRAGMENFVSSWLAQKNAAAQEGIVYRIAQDITYEEVRIDAAYCATLEEVENAFVKHATLDLA